MDCMTMSCVHKLLPPLQNSYVETLIPNAMVFEDEAFGR